VIRLAAIALVAAAVPMLASCGGGALPGSGDPAEQRSTLDQAAIDAGVIADPETIDLAGLYTNAGGGGPDRLCASGARDAGYSIGLLVAFGARSQCEATGAARFDGDRVAIEVLRTASGKPVADCRFLARFDGAQLSLPGSVPAACAAACTPRASLAGAVFALADSGSAAARTAHGRAIKRLCR